MGRMPRNVSVISAEDERNRRVVFDVLSRLGKYTRGYLRYHRLQVDEDFSSNPATVVIRVWWKNGKENRLASEQDQI